MEATQAFLISLYAIGRSGSQCGGERYNGQYLDADKNGIRAVNYRGAHFYRLRQPPTQTARRFMRWDY